MYVHHQNKHGFGRLRLSVVEKAELVRRATRIQQDLVALRARVILLVAAGCPWSEIIVRLGCSRGFISRWSSRFYNQRMAGLTARHRGRAASKVSPGLEENIVRAALSLSADGKFKWTTRSLAHQLDLSHMTVQRAWKKHGVDRGKH